MFKTSHKLEGKLARSNIHIRSERLRSNIRASHLLQKVIDQQPQNDIHTKFGSNILHANK